MLIWLKFIALCHGLCVYTCACVCAHGHVRAWVCEHVCACVRVFKVSLLAQVRKSWCLLLVAADTESCGGVGCFHLVLPQWKQPSPQHKAHQTAKSLPRWLMWFHNPRVLIELHYVSPFCRWKTLGAVAGKVKCLDQRTKCTLGRPHSEASGVLLKPNLVSYTL